MTNLVEAGVCFKSELRSLQAQTLQTGTGQCFNEPGVSAVYVLQCHI